MKRRDILPALLDQLELQLEELSAAAGEDESKAEAPSAQVQGFTRRKAVRRNFSEHLPEHVREKFSCRSCETLHR